MPQPMSDSIFGKVQAISSMLFLGVDQTGAIRPKSRKSQRGPRKSVAADQAQPLPCCWLIGCDIEFGELEDFNSSSIQSVLGSRNNLSIAVDVVLGLPQSHPQSWRSAMAKAARQDRLGRDAAEKFFEELAKDLPPGDSGHRRVDRKVGAMSVFQAKPYQRNVQTGTYRIWRDLGRDPDWFTAPEIEKRATGVPLYEAYPSFIWQTLLGFRRRSPEFLSSWLRSQRSLKLKWSASHQRLVEKSTDHADAFVVALALREAYANGNLPDSCECHPEGWILGVPRDSN